MFDRGANLRHDIGTEPAGYGEQSVRDLACALDGKGFGSEQLGAQARTAPERRRLLRSDRHGRLQTGELVCGEDNLDYDRAPARSISKRCRLALCIL